MSHTIHPSIVHIGLTPTTTRTYPLGFPALDEGSDGRGALRTGEIALLEGPARAGRTAKLLDIVATTTHACAEDDYGVVLVAVVEDSLETILTRLRAAGLTEDAVARRIRIARTLTGSDLAMFVARVVENGETPAALLIDDLGVVDDSRAGTRAQAHDAVARTLTMIAHGRVADALSSSTGLPFGAFALARTTAYTDPVAVLGTLRTPRDGSPFAGPLLQPATTVVDLGGVARKRRYA